MNDNEQILLNRLQRARLVATCLLLSMVVLFLVSIRLTEQYPWVALIVAFAEAAVIGGLADWFAVSALFRHPFNLPIPHTAIIPARKNDIGRALANFISEHFLVRSAVDRRLADARLARRLGEWLQQPANSARVSSDLCMGLDWLLRGVDSSDLRGGVKATLFDIAERLPMHEAMAAIIDVLASGDNAELLIDQLVAFGRQQLDDNRQTIRARIEERSPWWMPKFVDEEIYDQLVTEFERLLGEIASQQGHPARQELQARLKSLRSSLLEDPEFRARGHQLREDFVGHPAVQAFVQSLWDKTRDYLHGALTDADSVLHRSIQTEVAQVGRLLAEDQAAQQKLDRWLRESVGFLVDKYSVPLTAIISDTVEEWDAQSTSERIELHIGKDLQFIRINGTLVGGLVGVLLYIAQRVAAG